MADQNSSQQSQPQNLPSPVSSFLTSPKFKGFIKQNNEALISPNSILDNNPFFTLPNPFWYDKTNHLIKSPKAKETSSEKRHASRANNVGLKLIDTLEDENIKNNKRVFASSKLRVQIPHLSLFQTKSPNSQELTLKSSSSSSTSHARNHSQECMSVSEMEQSEEYTCVIAHGHSPRTTHIFNNCIVEGYCSLADKFKCATKALEKKRDFLSFCYTCKEKLEETKDIYIYRGEKAFCSSDCRYQEMLVDGAENSEFDA